jgi:glycosyltransferase involved in cell wall biosynthesis
MKILIVLPSYNEAKILDANVSQLVEFCRANLIGHDFKIIISDNNSKDNTKEVALALQSKYPEVDYLFVPLQGKGNAISSPWLKWRNEYDVFMFMDADLATDLQSLPDLVNGINQGFDLVIGSRNLASSKVKRTLFRRFFSWGYRSALKIILNTKVLDMPCGFKAVTQKIVNSLVGQIQEQTWFWDSELIYLAEKKGYKIKEVPVKWQEPRSGDDKSRVSFISVSRLYLKKAWGLRKRKITAE